MVNPDNIVAHPSVGNPFRQSADELGMDYEELKHYVLDYPGEAVVRVDLNSDGIDARYRERIFKLFERLDPSIEGTGIGLSVVKRIIEAHEGRVWAESDGVGQGTQICFVLPYAD